MPCQGGIQLQKKNVVQNKMQDMEYTAIMSGLWNQDLPVSFSPTRAASVSSLTSAMLGSPGANSAQQEVELHQQAPRSVPTPVALSLSCSSSSPSRDLTEPSNAVLAQQEVELHQQAMNGPVFSSSHRLPKAI